MPMKKLLPRLVFAVLAAISLAGCAVFNPQNSRDFEGRKTYFIKTSQGGGYVLGIFRRAQIDEILQSQISESLAEKGYERVFDESIADFTLTPVYVEWSLPSPRDFAKYPSVYDSGYGFFDGGFRSYVDLSVYARLSGSKSVAWSGYSLYKLRSRNFTVFGMRMQVREALAFFPKYADGGSAKPPQKSAEKSSGSAK